MIAPHVVDEGESETPVGGDEIENVIGSSSSIPFELNELIVIVSLVVVEIEGVTDAAGVKFTVVNSTVFTSIRNVYCVPTFKLEPPVIVSASAV